MTDCCRTYKDLAFWDLFSWSPLSMKPLTLKKKKKITLFIQKQPSVGQKYFPFPLIKCNFEVGVGRAAGWTSTISYPPLACPEIRDRWAPVEEFTANKKQGKQAVCLLIQGNSHGKDKERKKPCLMKETVHKCRKAPWS